MLLVRGLSRVRQRSHHSYWKCCQFRHRTWSLHSVSAVSLFPHRLCSSLTTTSPVETLDTTTTQNKSMSGVEDERIYSIIHGSMGPKFRLFIRSQIKIIAEDPVVLVKVKTMYIDEKLWRTYAFDLRRKIVKVPENVFEGQKLVEFFVLVEDVLKHDDSRDDEDALDKKIFKFRTFLVDAMLLIAEKELRDEVASTLALLSCSDLRLPHEWYAPARLMKRKIIFHGGPTNSGKTYHALQRLMAADVNYGGGLYCGPLRLLALEVFDQLNKAGVYCDLVTGQEQTRIPFSTHTSCTVEVVPVDVPYDVAIIDEIQMINDESRGYAWTRALLGLNAREIHLAGGLEAADIVRTMTEKTGDSFELRKYERLSKLVVQQESLKGDYTKVRPGDCIVAFSKFDIFSIKREIESLTKYKCCVVYGKLPPETRSKQARLFNEPDTGYDILVASDAIGMGLNLNIRRIIFHTAVKPGYGRKKTGPQFIEPGSIKQIAGRAGRLSSEYSFGEVTAWQEVDLAYIRSVMNFDVPEITAAGIFPSVEQIDLFSRELAKHQEVRTTESEEEDIPQTHDDQQSENAATGGDKNSTLSGSSPNGSIIEHTRLSLLLKKFLETSQTSGHYFLCEHGNLVKISNWLNSIPLSLPDRFVFGTAPVSMMDNISVNMLYRYAAIYATKRPVPLSIRFPKKEPSDLPQFTELCDKHNILDLYLWLSNRFPKYFIEKENCMELKEYALRVIQSTLEKSMLKQKYSHSQTFRSRRQRMCGPAGDITDLPASLPSRLRNEMLESLKDIPDEEWYTFPNESFSGEETVEKSGEKRRTKKTEGNNTRIFPSKDIPSKNSNIANGDDKAAKSVKVMKKHENKDKSSHGVKVATPGGERITRSADGRKIQKWIN